MFGVGSSKLDDPYEAGKEAAKKALEAVKGRLRFTLAFSSYSKYPDAMPLLRGINEVLGDVPLYGSSTAGEFTTEGPSRDSVVVFVSTCPVSYLGVGVGEGVDVNPKGAGARAVKEAIDWLPFEFRDLPLRVHDLIYSPYFVLTTSAIGHEEAVIEGVKDVVGVTPIVGGSSADDFKLTPPFGYQMANYRAYTRSVVVGVLATKHKVGMGFAHAYEPTDKRGVITRAKGRDILTIDERAAAEVYADWVGVPLEKLNVLAQGLSNPLGVLDQNGRFYWIKHVLFATAEGGLSAAAAFPTGTTVTLMKTTVEGQVEATRRAAKEALDGCEGKAMAAILFHCAGRAAYLGDEGLAKAFKAMREELGDVPIVGFNVYGEQAAPLYGSVGHHNLTVAVLAIGKRQL